MKAFFARGSHKIMTCAHRRGRKCRELGLTVDTRVRKCLRESAPHCHGVFLFVQQFHRRGGCYRTAEIFFKKHDLRRSGSYLLLTLLPLLPVSPEQPLWSHCAKKTGLSDGSTDGQQEMWYALVIFQIGFDEWLRRHSLLQSQNSCRTALCSCMYDTIIPGIRCARYCLLDCPSSSSHRAGLGCLVEKKTT